MMCCSIVNNCLIAPALPKIGETIFVNDVGHALVESIAHKDIVQLGFKESEIGEFRTELPIEIQGVQK